MKPCGFEGCSPNYGICPDAVEVMMWQALACTDLNPVRVQAIVRAGRIIGSCERCESGSLLQGDPTKVCKMVGLAISFTSLGPEVPDVAT